MTPIKTFLAASVALVALLSAPAPVAAQSGDPLLRLIDTMLNGSHLRGGRGGWDDDDDDDDYDDDRRRRSRDDDDDDDDDDD